jgi:hypothetical protein
MEVGYLIARENEEGKWTLLDFSYKELAVYDTVEEVFNKMLELNASVKFTTFKAYQAELEFLAPYREQLYA